MSAPLPLAASPRSRMSAASAFARRVLALIDALRHRSETRSLLDLDDRALRDIGLTRGDVQDAIDLPLPRDPSILLTVRAVGHRSRIRLTPGPAARKAEPVAAR